MFGGDFIDHAHRRLRQNADGWGDHFHLILADFVERQKRLILPR